MFLSKHNRKILGNKIIAKKLTTELWKRLEEEWSKITPQQCEKLVIPCDHKCTDAIQCKTSTLP